MSSTGKSPVPRSPARIEQDAATWLVQQDNGPLTELQQRAFDKWYQESELHRSYYDRMSAFWSGMDGIGSSKDSLDDAVLKPTLMERLGLEVHYRVAASVAAAVLAVSGLFTVLIADNATLDSAQFVEREYRTVTGDQKNIELPDGSSVMLNTASHIRIAYTSDQRIIHLLKGEGYFSVETDPSRPFLVRVDDHVVSAVGTAFTVFRNNAGIDVTVTEGDVDVFLMGATNDTLDSLEQRIPNVQLTARESVVFTDNVEPVKVVSATDINRKLAWRQGVLAFAGEPLPNVVAEVSRYTDLKIIISDESLEELRFGGVLRIGNIDALFNALEQSFGVKIERKPDGLVYLSAANET